MREPARRRQEVVWPQLSVIHLIIVLNLLCFFFGGSLIEAIAGGSLAPHSGHGGMVSPLEDYAGFSLSALSAGRFWVLISHMFVHVGPLHLLGNLMIIYLAGTRLTQLLGSKPFLVIYFVGGLVGAIVQIMIERWVGAPAGVPVVGASACACAVGFALAAVLPRENATSMIYFILPVNLQLWTLALAALAVEALLGLCAIAVPSVWWGGQAYFAHIGGALFGWYVIRLMGYGGQPMTYANLWHSQPGQNRPAVRRRQQRSVARMRRLRDLTPEMDHEAIERDLRSKSKSRSLISAVDEVDSVLDKINREGMKSLTEAERRILETASRDLSRKSSGARK